MSFIRMSDDSDIYAYPCGNGTVQIHVKDGHNFNVNSDDSFIYVMNTLHIDGYKVPEFLLTLKPFETGRVRGL